jgi:hypothetical protein
MGIDDKTVRDCLRVRKINGLPFLQSSTEFSLHLYRANLDTGLAEITTIRIYETRFLNDRNSKIPSLSFNCGNF